MITFKNVTLRRGANVLLESVNWTIFHKQRIGIIGANGAGKTSLFGLLLNELQPDLGDLDIPRHITIAHVAQETAATDKSALDYVLDGDTEWRALQDKLLIAEQQEDGEKIIALHEKIAAIDGYAAPSRAAQLLAGLGFAHEGQQKPVSSYSGGWRVRLNLAKALMCRSDVLLLDEPTNHLDLDAVLWLEQWLMKYAGTLLLISHDRDFLDQTIDHIVHLSHQQLKLYTGNYSLFEKQRAEAMLLQQATYEKQQRQLAHLQSFVNRFRAKASKAKQAQSRLKAIDRMDLVCAVQSESPFQFSFREPGRCPNPLLTLQHAKIAYGDHVIFEHLNVGLTPSDRIAILGPNGAGKSSLIKLLAGELMPANGIREAAPGLKIGYFAQHQVDHLRLDETPLDHLRDLAEKEPEVELRKYLGSFGFIGNRVFEPVANFSGGEKSRLALALIVWQKPNLLLLDEPTNHLDLEMRQALSLALQGFEGAMLLVSHDRFLVRTTTDRFMLAADGQLQEFEGDLIDYQKWLLDYRKKQAAAEKPAEGTNFSKKSQRQEQAKQRDSSRPLLQKIQQIEKTLSKLQHEATAIEESLLDHGLYEADNKQKLQTILKQQADLKQVITQTENEWLQLCEERDN